MPSKIIAKETNCFSAVYSAWFGKAVVLFVAVRQCRVPMLCTIVSESATDVRIRMRPGWQMDIRKELILAIEENAEALHSRIN